jgi:nicotinamidase/pyrazinamidase
MYKGLKIATLGIDPEFDFMEGGALPVAGATADMQRAAKFHDANQGVIDEAHVTIDVHFPMSIHLTSWWKDKDGNHPDPYTVISVEDVENGRWIPQVAPPYSLDYLRKLRAKGRFPHIVWPDHCIAGSNGISVQADLHAALMRWTVRHRRMINFLTKGVNPAAEHFGALMAEVPIPGDPTTQANTDFVRTLEQNDLVFAYGEARNFCFATTLEQLCDLAPSLIPKMVILEDCMSDVPNVPQAVTDRVNAIFDRAQQMGARFGKSTDPIDQFVTAPASVN